MCGITGLFNPTYISMREAQAIVCAMNGSLIHRGPDSGDAWFDDRHRCFLGHRRLSIIDPSDAGRQPMESASGRWVLTFNGEIYNFQELRPIIEARGLAFQGRTDTEVLLNAIALWGVDALPKLDGMFAFAAFNKESGELILARDPFGEKPLYYMELQGGGLAFASELQALQHVPGFDPEISLDAMAEVLMFQYIGAPRTIYSKVKKLPPGCWLSARPGEPSKIGRYFEFQPGLGGFDERPIAELADELEDILARSLRRRLISDVPLGAFLSGGVDSSTVCALVRRKLGLPLKTFSIGFDKAVESEHEVARQFARHLGTEHFDQILAPDTSNFLVGMGRILDEPNADSSCMPTYLLSEFARQHVTVALSGDGGDEMFAGYGRYFSTLDDSSARSAGWSPGDAYYSDRILVSTEKYIEELFGAVPEGLASHLRRLRDEINGGSVSSLFCRLRKSDVENYMPGAVLPKVDRMSMQHSLEVRTPFLSVELARFAERLPLSVLYRRGKGKLVLRELAYRYLPKELIDLPKQGFGVPMSRWGKEELLGVAKKLLGADESRLRSMLGTAAIARFMERQRSLGGFSTYQVWAIAMLESWVRHHPAKLPELEIRRPISTRSRRSFDGAIPPLAAWPISENLYMILEDPTIRFDRQLFNGDIQDSRVRAVVERAFQLALYAASADPAFERDSAVKPTPIMLPGWGAKLESVTEELRKLKGATLLFPQTDPSQRIDANEVAKLQALRVDSVVFFHPHRVDGSVFRLKLRSESARPGSEALRRHAISRFGALQPILSGFRASAARHSHGQRYESGAISGVAPIPATELSSRYMLFEGTRQLPPVPVSHEDIARLGRGRYSVWGQHCIFSPTSRFNYFARPYWLVERNAATEHLLQLIPEVSWQEGSDKTSFITRVQQMCRAKGTLDVFCTLRPGDRVVVMTHALTPGGAERQWCYLAIALKTLGYDVHFVVIDRLEGDGGHYMPLLQRHDITPVELTAQSLGEVLQGLPRGAVEKPLLSPNPSPFGVSLDLLSSLLNRFGPKAVFAQLDSPNLLAAVAAHLANVPRVVLSFRNYNPSNFSYLSNDWFQDCYRAVCLSQRTLLSGNSHAANTDYARWIGVEDDRVTWIPNAIDASDFRPGSDSEIEQLRQSLDIASTAPVILGVFRLSEEKQPLRFIDVCARIRRHIPGVRVLIAGEGPLRRAVEEEIDREGLREAVTLLGRRTDIADLMSISSLLLLTSSHEGMPNVAMEAQLLGLPVVATRVGGTPDCVVHGETGLLTEPGDVEDLAACCIRVLLNKGMAQELGRAGTARMRCYFSKEKMAETYIQIINQMALPDNSLASRSVTNS